MVLVTSLDSTGFYSHVICLGTKIMFNALLALELFYSHVICLGTKIMWRDIKWKGCFTVT